MNLTLQRTDFREDGIFSKLSSANDQIAVTLEHSYDNKPKVPDGQYRCVRGIHQLEHGGQFETFEVTGVAGHSGILFHVGNYNQDSEGCILLGQDISKGASWMISNSKATFDKFMELQKGLNDFVLIVRS